MIVVALAALGLAAFLSLMAYLNGGSSPAWHIDTPPSWPTGGAPGHDEPLHR